MHRTEMSVKYEFVQVKGQMKYGPPPDWIGPPPPKGSEVFVGKLPRDVLKLEDELMPLFSNIGPIYEFRLMVEFSKYCKGFAFVTYTNIEDAEKAIKVLDNYPLRPNRLIGVVRSNDNCKMFIGGIPTAVTHDMVLQELSRLTEGIIGVKLSDNLWEPGKNRGYAFVEYESHRAASIARRILLAYDCLVFGRHVSVEWADLSVDVVNYNPPKILYVRNIPTDIKDELLYELFSVNGLYVIEKIKRIKNFAFVHYSSRENAENALGKINGYVWNGWTIDATWAKSFPSLKRHTEGYERSIVNSVSPSLSSCDFTLQMPPPLTLSSTPIQMLEDICVSNGWGIPIYSFSINQATMINPFLSYSIKVSIPNIPFMEKEFAPSGSFFSPIEAQCYSALFALKKLGFVDGGYMSTAKYNSLDQMERVRSKWSQDDFEAKINASLSLLQNPRPFPSSNLRLNTDPLNLLAAAASLVNKKIQSEADSSIFYLK